MLDEQDIAKRCAKGDNVARRQLYEAYAGWMLGVCIRYVGNRDKAQDLLHDGFVKIFDKIVDYKWMGEGSLKAWMFRVQQNVILTYLRQQKSWGDEVVVSDLPDVEDEPEIASDIPPKIIAQMIASLPVGYRTVFNMYVVDGFSHRQIAEALGIKEKSSASQLSHARQLLATEINAWRRNNL